MPYPNPFVFADIIYTTKRRTCSNRVYGALATALTTQAGVDTLCQNIDGIFAEALIPLLSSDCRYQGTYLRYINGALDLESSYSGNGDTGGGDPDPLPDEVTVSIQKRTGQQGRDKRGRYFFSGVPQSGNDDGVLTSGLKTVLGNLAAVLSSDMTVSGNTWHQRHYDRKTNSLVVVTQCRPLGVFTSRRDRRKPLVALPF